MLYRRIKGSKIIYVNEYGEIRNRKTGNILKPYQKNGYLYVKYYEDGKSHHVSVHRAVGFAFVKGHSQERNIIDHIDGNKQNNHKSNLRWVTQQENLLYGYERRNDTPVRNFVNCTLYYKGEKVKRFKSVAKACRYATKYYDCSYSMLHKHREHKDCKIISRSVKTIPQGSRKRDQHVSEAHRSHKSK